MNKAEQLIGAIIHENPIAQELVNLFKESTLVTDYKLEPASSFETGLIYKDKGVRTWYNSQFGDEKPTLDHALVQEAIKNHTAIYESLMSALPKTYTCQNCDKEVPFFETHRVDCHLP